MVKEIEHRSAYLKESRDGILIFKRNELFIEIMIQLPIHLCMLLLSITEFPTESGLQATFKQSNTLKPGTVALLLFSTLWSMKTSALTYVKIKTEERQFMNLAAKFFLGVRSMVVFSIRVVCAVAYFAPFLGLCGLLKHHKAEQIPLSPATLHNMQKHSSDYHFWNKRDEVFQKLSSVSKKYPSHQTLNR